MVGRIMRKVAALHLHAAFAYESGRRNLQNGPPAKESGEVARNGFI